MVTLLRMLCLISSSLLSFVLFANEGLTVTSGSQPFDQEKCVNDKSQNCISTICLTSTQRDCQATCKKEAKKKCEQQTRE